jgi:hypothetical protein
LLKASRQDLAECQVNVGPRPLQYGLLAAAGGLLLLLGVLLVVFRYEALLLLHLGRNKLAAAKGSNASNKPGQDFSSLWEPRPFKVRVRATLCLFLDYLVYSK